MNTKNNLKISYECSELIEELKQDISEFGEHKMLAVFMRYFPQYNVEFAVNYDFIVDEDKIEQEVGENERIVLMEAGILLDKLENQNGFL